MKKGSSILSMLIALVVIMVLFYIIGPKLKSDKGVVGRLKNSGSTYSQAKSKAEKIVELSNKRSFKTE